MELTMKQEEGLKIAVARYHYGEKYTVISGYAGSGKSTTVRAIVEALDIPEKDVCYATFTGKASEVLRKKGNQNAITLHKLLYDFIPQKDGTFIKIAKDQLAYSLIIIDECSMVPKEMIEQLMKYHGIYMIFLGDPGQLPPISKDTDNHLLDHPHIFFNEIMRQAQDSEIIRLSMDIREGKPLSLFNGKDVQVLNKNNLNMGMLTWADIVLVGTNNTRRSLNQQIRQYLGFTKLTPQENDKIICCRNDWQTLSDKESPLINGSLGRLANTYESFIHYPSWMKIDSIPVMEGEFVTEEGERFSNLILDKEFFTSGQKALSKQQEYLISRSKTHRKKVLKEFDYGYCITVHKAQGSEWDKVLVFEESFPFDKEEHARWLYTAVTRSSKKCVLIKNS